ncbi:MAG: Hsp20/alpha crystallin family protein [Saprospiraceae bacterium]
MSLIKWNPERNLFPAFTNWMDDFFTEEGFMPKVKGISIPAVNIKENEKSFKLELAAPGFKKEDFKLEMQNGALVISGETKEEKEEKDESFTRREYSFNKFSRSFTLPENVKKDDISAVYKDGVLKIELPKAKAEEKPSKLISVN